MFSAPGHWYKGNLHTHTNLSDGALPPEEAVARYKAAGYDFICVTDHRVTADVAAQSSVDFLTIPSIELDCKDPDTQAGYHVVGIGVAPFTQDSDTRSGPGQALVDIIRNQGGEAILAHPYWLGQDTDDLQDIKGALAVEVYNATCARIGRADSAWMWDLLLDKGSRLLGVAVDDAHKFIDDFALGWVMVKAPELTQEAILAALRAGHFYATQGPAILDIRRSGDQILIRTSPVKEIRLMANRSRGRLEKAPAGAEITGAALNVWPNLKGYMRVEITDAQGRKAWSQPLFTGGGDDAHRNI